MKRNTKIYFSVFLLLSAIALPLVMQTQKNVEIFGETFSGQVEIEVHVKTGDYKISVSHVFMYVGEMAKNGYVQVNQSGTNEEMLLFSYTLEPQSQEIETITNSRSCYLPEGNYSIYVYQESGGIAENYLEMEKEGIFTESFAQINTVIGVYAIFAGLFGILFLCMGVMSPKEINNKG